MKSREIRKKFIDFFVKHHHTNVPSSSLIPAQDPTLLFTNAGMNQFKDLFLGKEERSYKRAVSIQKCIRAGGKHNDLENVGFTKRHLTFFEMLGNFSFGDYFKRDAIIFAWEFLTKELGLDTSKLYASVYKHDDEAYALWNKEIGLPENRIVRLGEADNFWQMGDTGPCGPCSEIYIDRGISFGCGKSDCAPGCSCDRFLEIWNLVFMQFNRQPDGTDLPLKQKGVDTGMGMERLCAIMQGKDSVFDIDLFAPMIKKAEELSGKSYATSSPELQAAFRVLADHIRSTSFAIADGCSPSNEGRGYVLRKIIRRGALFAQKLGDTAFFYKIAPALIEEMGHVYPELVEQQELIVTVLKSEVEKFTNSLETGQALLAKYFAEHGNSKIIDGAHAFKLYDTYGFPLELTKVIAYDKGYTVDVEGFEAEMERQRVQSGKKNESADSQTLDISTVTEFTGYDEHETTSVIKHIIVENKLVNSVLKNQRCWIITERTPFYVECGGQVNDRGYIEIAGYKTPLLNLKKIGKAIASEIEAPVQLTLATQVKQVVDTEFRTNTRKNHTATHLLQSALMKVLGKNVRQSGSLVTADYLRFDFTCPTAPTQQEIDDVEKIVNNHITANIPLGISTTTYQKAVDRGVIAFFGEKYNPESVRVVEIPGASAELCGGTHVRATGDIGCFKITEVSSLSAGNRRIVAVTGPKAIELFQQTFATVKTLCTEFKAQPHAILDAINKQRAELKGALQEIKQLKKQIIAHRVPEWIAHITEINTIPFGFVDAQGSAADELKDLAALLITKKPALYVLVSEHEGRASVFVQATPELAQRISLKNFAEFLKTLGIRGGASQTTFQGGAVSLNKELKTKIVQWLQTL